MSHPDSFKVGSRQNISVTQSSEEYIVSSSERRRELKRRRHRKKKLAILKRRHTGASSSEKQHIADKVRALTPGGEEILSNWTEE